MKITEEELKGLLPNIRGLVEPRAEQRLYEAFRRIYEFMIFKLTEQQKDFDNKIASIASSANTNINNLINANSLVGAYSQPLVGGGKADPVLQSIVSSYGSQPPNTFLAGPLPSFRALTLADLPAIPATPATQLDADGTILDVNTIAPGEYVKRIGNTLVSGFPIGTNNIGEGIMPVIEGILYTVPVGYKTLFRILILDNISGGALNVNIRTTDDLGVTIYSNVFPVAAGTTVNLILNLILQENHTIRGDTTIGGAINYSIFGSQESI